VPKNSTVETFDWDPMVWRKYIYAFWSLCEVLFELFDSEKIPIVMNKFFIILKIATM
jgi:hypothetical protein